MSLPANSVNAAGGGPGNTAFSASFEYVQTQLQVTATSPAVGSILYAPVTDLVVQFNTAFNPYSISASDFQLSQGTVTKAVPLTKEAVDLTLSGVTQDGSLTLTIPAGSILDPYGVGNIAFSGSYIIQVNSQPFPTPFSPADPAGSLIYDPSVSGAINFNGDTDTYTLPLAANQSLTMVLAVDAEPDRRGATPRSRRPHRRLGRRVRSGLSGRAPDCPGRHCRHLLAGGHRRQDTQGNYTLSAILNAAYKQSTDSINTIGTAYR